MLRSRFFDSRGDAADDVSEVINEMTSHPSAEHVPSLQGESSRPGQWSTWMRSSWSPASMAAAAAALALVGGAALRARS